MPRKGNTGAAGRAASRASTQRKRHEATRRSHANRKRLNSDPNANKAAQATAKRAKAAGFGSRLKDAASGLASATSDIAMFTGGPGGANPEAALDAAARGENPVKNLARVYDVTRDVAPGALASEGGRELEAGFLSIVAGDSRQLPTHRELDAILDGADRLVAYLKKPRLDYSDLADFVELLEMMKLVTPQLRAIDSLAERLG